jgi:hypothetical protein
MSAISASQLATLLQVRISLAGRDRLIELSVPTVRQIVPLILPPERRTSEQLRSRLTTEIQAVVKSVEGAPVDRAMADAICADPAALSAVLRARGSAFAALSERGRIYALCPHCRKRETEFSVFGLVAGLEDGPWPVTDVDGLIEIPALATLRPTGERPKDQARAAHIRLRMASAECGLSAGVESAVLGDVTAETDAQGWRQWAPSDVEQPDERFYWRYQNPAFRALLRLAVALRTIDERTDVTPESIEALPIIDFFFLDSAYYLTHNVPVRAGQLDIRCETCGGIFLPVR